MFKKRDGRNEKTLLEGLKDDDESAFNAIFETYYKDLVLFAGRIVSSRVICEDIVQSVFMQLWDDRKTVSVESSLKSLLLKSVQNRCLNILRRQLYEKDYLDFMRQQKDIGVPTPENYLLYSEIHTRLERALASLPEKQREAFELNRIRGLKYREIAALLHVSQRTVEVRIAQALKMLRIALDELFPT